MYLELIETLWNVNIKDSYSLQIVSYELIETLWNVNKIDKTFELSSEYGINRNIVECK